MVIEYWLVIDFYIDHLPDKNLVSFTFVSFRDFYL